MLITHIYTSGLLNTKLYLTYLFFLFVSNKLQTAEPIKSNFCVGPHLRPQGRYMGC